MYQLNHYNVTLGIHGFHWQQASLLGWGRGERLFLHRKCYNTPQAQSLQALAAVLSVTPRNSWHPNSDRPQKVYFPTTKFAFSGLQYSKRDPQRGVGFLHQKETWTVFNRVLAWDVRHLWDNKSVGGGKGGVLESVILTLG